MPFQIEERTTHGGTKSHEVYVLTDPAETARLEVWPSVGFNALRWQVKLPDGSFGDLLYRDPNWETNTAPTRSGHPILFPFPNRLEQGRFTHEGKTYQLPLNDSTNTHAIHGFTPRVEWIEPEFERDRDIGIFRAEYQMSADMLACGLWPANFFILVTYLFSNGNLYVETEVKNLDKHNSLPFGLGFHPYFVHPLAPNASVDELVLKSVASQTWETENGIPNGRQLPISSELDFRTPRAVGPTQLDTYFTGLNLVDGNPLQEVAALGHTKLPGVLRVKVQRDFRELVLFTPPHRKAIAIEPYTCAANAANLQARGIDAGWRTIPPGETTKLLVQYEWRPDDRL